MPAKTQSEATTTRRPAPAVALNGLGSSRDWTSRHHESEAAAAAPAARGAASAEVAPVSVPDGGLERRSKVRACCVCQWSMAPLSRGIGADCAHDQGLPALDIRAVTHTSGSLATCASFQLAGPHLVDRWQAYKLREEWRERNGKRALPGGSQRCVEQVARWPVKRHAPLDAERLARVEPSVDGQSEAEPDDRRQCQRRHGFGVHPKVGGSLRLELDLQVLGRPHRREEAEARAAEDAAGGGSPAAAGEVVSVCDGCTSDGRNDETGGGDGCCSAASEWSRGSVPCVAAAGAAFTVPSACHAVPTVAAIGSPALRTARWHRSRRKHLEHLMAACGRSEQNEWRAVSTPASVVDFGTRP
eukprot:scaffold12827_cov123-Isochrysis_galbana.AAC.3